MPSPGTNWIGGEPASALSGATWERAGAEGVPAARWPRSGAHDLSRALALARAAQAAWRRLGAAERRERLEACARALCDEPDPGGLASAALGFDEGELAQHAAGLARELEQALWGAEDLARSPLGAREGPCLLAPAWHATWGAARAVFFALRAGRAVVFAPDPELPTLGDALARALASLPAGAFAVLHDDGQSLLRAARGEPGLDSIHVAESRAAGEAEPAAPGDSASATETPFEERWRARASTFVVRADDDLAEQAARALELSVSRTGALSGSRDGQVGRVVCPERSFAAFTAALIDAIEASADVARPLPLARRAQEADLEAAFELGLDEGATCILSGPGREHRLFPVLLTNVEPRMRVARYGAPCALVCLLRARDEGHARALAERLGRA